MLSKRHQTERLIGAVSGTLFCGAAITHTLYTMQLLTPLRFQAGILLGMLIGFTGMTLFQYFQPDSYQHNIDLPDQ